MGSRRLRVLSLAAGPAGGARLFWGEGQLCIPWQEWQALYVCSFGSCCVYSSSRGGTGGVSRIELGSRSCWFWAVYLLMLCVCV